jgi:hypothetical protein
MAANALIIADQEDVTAKIAALLPGEGIAVHTGSIPARTRSTPKGKWIHEADRGISKVERRTLNIER